MINFIKKSSARNSWKTFPWATSGQHQDCLLKPLISVVLPVYNQASLVKHSLDSIISKNNFPLEVIIVDDGSTDQLKDAVKPYIQDSKKNVSYFYQKNQRLSTALNTGFSLAKGVFLSWTSADNLYLPGALEKMADFLLANPSIDLVYANVELIDDFGKKIKNSNYRKDNQDKNNSSILRLPSNSSTLIEYNDNFINACFMYRKDSRLLAGNYDPDKNGYEDYDYWCRICSTGKIAHIDTEKPLYQYRLHENSMTHQLKESNLNELQSHSVFAANKKARLLKDRFKIELQGNNDDEFAASITTLLEEDNTEIAFKSSDNINLITLTTNENENSNKLLILRNNDLILNKESFLHPNHFNYFSKINTPFLAICLSEKPNSKKQFLPHSLFLPPIVLPNILRRARDGKMGAVSPHQGSKLSALIFAADLDYQNKEDLSWQLKECLALIKNLPEVTFAFLCQSSGQKDFCNKIKENAEKYPNFQILDISTQEHHIKDLKSENFSSLNYQDKSLLYTLSSVDTIVSLKSSANLASILELRQEVALACMAGVGVNCILKDNSPDNRFNLSTDILTAISSPELNLSLEHTFAQSLNLSFSSLMATNLSLTLRNENNFHSNIYNKLAKSTKLMNIESLEQWLKINTEKEIAKRIKTLLFASIV